MFAWRFEQSITQRRYFRVFISDSDERRLLYLQPILLFAVLLITVLGLGGCLLAPTKTGAEVIVYLGWDDLGREQLYVLDLDEKPRQLTTFATGVHDYAPSVDGRYIALSVIGENGEMEVWIMDADGSSLRELHSCPQAECSNFVWAPDSRRLLFEQREIGSDEIAGGPTLWWLDTQLATALPLQEGNSEPGAAGSLSPDGQWLSYHSPHKEGLLIYNLEDGRSQLLANEIGTAGVWSPDSQQLVVPIMDLVILHGEEGDDHQTHEHDYQTAVRLLRLDVGSGKQHNISGDIRAEDSVPSWSPDGRWIAFGRRATGTGAARQLWIMRPDGSEVRALTDDPLTNHGPPSWSADGRYLLFQQIGQDDLASHPGIWRIDVESGEKGQLVSSGMRPAWLPPSV